MPVHITRVRGGWRVATAGGVKAKRTTRAKAEAQKRIIEAADNPGARHGVALGRIASNRFRRLRSRS